MRKQNNVQKTVSDIIAKVRFGGDKALFFFEKKYGSISLNEKNLRFVKKDFDGALKKLPADTRKSLETAAKNIFFYQKKIRALYKDVKVKRPGLTLAHRFRALSKTAVYVPGGRYFYPSTVLMNAIPAKAAGVDEIYAASCGVSDEVLASCALSGVKSLFRISGAQAIASFAMGTESVPKVDFIAGPGNKYVTEAKRQLFGETGIDLLAGPSEVLVLADGSVPEEWVLADLAAQLEHAPDARASLITPSKKLLNFITAVFGGKVKAFLIKDKKKQIEKADEIAPEHLIVMMKNSAGYEGNFKNAGAVFLGKYSPVALGDYAAGPSHTLPTGKSAVFSSGLNAGSFLRSYAEIKYEKKGFESDSDFAAIIAGAEGMANHKKSIEIRKVKRC
ncbi:MAG: histidinol dehydrogenase [Elusimicrobia bacterium HGW-Elusimicrobia-2]|nr:MAG: histidinol dehydrogenase [Elusimicrobia bacterium HGW-Elusimicrobia-2]